VARVDHSHIGCESPCVSLQEQRSNNDIFFTSYALTGLAFPPSFFFLLVLETYGLQMTHLSLHSMLMVAIFVSL
jgi:hypothetical protein